MSTTDSSEGKELPSNYDAREDGYAILLIRLRLYFSQLADRLLRSCISGRELLRFGSVLGSGATWLRIVRQCVAPALLPVQVIPLTKTGTDKSISTPPGEAPGRDPGVCATQACPSPVAAML